MCTQSSGIIVFFQFTISFIAQQRKRLSVSFRIFLKSVLSFFVLSPKNQFVTEFCHLNNVEGIILFNLDFPNIRYILGNSFLFLADAIKINFFTFTIFETSTAIIPPKD